MTSSYEPNRTGLAALAFSFLSVFLQINKVLAIDQVDGCHLDSLPPSIRHDFQAAFLGEYDQVVSNQGSPWLLIAEDSCRQEPQKLLITLSQGDHANTHIYQRTITTTEPYVFLDNHFEGRDFSMLASIAPASNGADDWATAVALKFYNYDQTFKLEFTPLPSEGGLPDEDALPNLVLLNGGTLPNTSRNHHAVINLHQLFQTSTMQRREKRQMEEDGASGDFESGSGDFDNSTTPVSMFPKGGFNDADAGVFAIGFIIIFSAGVAAWVVSSIKYEPTRISHPSRFKAFLMALRGVSYIATAGTMGLLDLGIRLGYYVFGKPVPGFSLFFRGNKPQVPHVELVEVEGAGID